jgi:hemin uptake protein HemP
MAVTDNALSAELAPLVWSSETLFNGRQEIVIRHEGQDYRLRITRMNKMILTK